MAKTEETQIDEAYIDMTGLLNSRLFVYGLLRYFIDQPPEEKFLLALSADEKLVKLSEICKGGKMIYEYLQLFSSCDQDLELVEIKQEYEKLFVGPNLLPAPLWESVFLSDEHLMFGEETMQVREVYERYGLAYKNKANQPDDHIAVELDFMRFLINKSLMAYQNDHKGALSHLLEEQSTFLKDHLLRWAPPAFAIIINSTTSKLYQGLAFLLVEFLPSDLDIVESMKEDLFK